MPKKSSDLLLQPQNAAPIVTLLQKIRHDIAHSKDGRANREDIEEAKRQLTTLQNAAKTLNDKHLEGNEQNIKSILDTILGRQKMHSTSFYYPPIETLLDHPFVTSRTSTAERAVKPVSMRRNRLVAKAATVILFASTIPLILTPIGLGFALGGAFAAGVISIPFSTLAYFNAIAGAVSAWKVSNIDDLTTRYNTHYCSSHQNAHALTRRPIEQIKNAGRSIVNRFKRIGSAVKQTLFGQNSKSATQAEKTPLFNDVSMVELPTLSTKTNTVAEKAKKHSFITTANQQRNRAAAVSQGIATTSIFFPRVPTHELQSTSNNREKNNKDDESFKIRG